MSYNDIMRSIRSTFTEGRQLASLRTLTAGHAAWACAAAATLIALAAVAIAVYGALTSGDYRAILSHQTLTPFLAAGFTCIGALVAARHPRNWVGWIFVAAGLMFALIALAAALAGPALTTSPISRWAIWVGSWFWIPAQFLPEVFVRLLFPDGHLPSPRWRLVAWPAGLGLALITLAVMLHPGPLASWGLSANPFGIPGAAPLLEGALNLGIVGLAFGYLGSWGALFVRFRRSAGLQREQLKWLVYAMIISLLLSTLAWSAGAVWPGAAWTQEIAIAASDLGILGIVVAAAIAILRYRLYDIDLVINRTLVYSALTAGVAGLYVLVAGGLGILLQARGSLGLALVGVGMVAVVAQPLRDRLQRAVNRLMYGERDDPYAVLSRLGYQLGATLTPGETLTHLVETIARTLKLPYVAIVMGQAGRGPATAYGHYGRPAPVAVRLPLSYQSETVGVLLVAARSPAEAFTPAELRLLADIARQAGVAVHAAALTIALQQSRERLVTAREEERRRLRRDLHDGLGPTLASHAYRLEAALDLIDQDPAAAKRLLGEMKAQTQSTLADIRRLVYALRPPALDELGLVAALRAEFTDPARRLHIQVEAAPDPLPPLPAAAEVAAYRIVTEAVTNAARHAHARNCRVRLTVGVDGHALTVEVADDGQGLPAGVRWGVGLTSMRERAAELGGQCQVTSDPAGGTRVLARLPLSDRPSDDLSHLMQESAMTPSSAETAQTFRRAVDYLVEAVGTGRLGFDYAVREYAQVFDNDVARAFQEFVRVMGLGTELMREVRPESLPQDQALRRDALAAIAAALPLPAVKVFSETMAAGQLTPEPPVCTLQRIAEQIQAL